jgi:hypothetical protein
MYTADELEEYVAEVREQVCSRCVERLPGGPPCSPLGKACPVEMHLPRYLDAIREVNSPFLGPYLDNLHDRVCARCERRGSDNCPCPMNYLLVLMVQAVETVNQRRRLPDGQATP